MECDNKVKSSSSSTNERSGCPLIQFHLPPTTPVIIIIIFRLPSAELHTLLLPRQNSISLKWTGSRTRQRQN